VDFNQHCEDFISFRVTERSKGSGESDILLRLINFRLWEKFPRFASILAPKGWVATLLREGVPVRTFQGLPFSGT
jgi:hypothetical protein